MTETEYIARIKELEELKNELIWSGKREDINSDIIRYELTTKQRNALILLILNAETDLAHPSWIDRVVMWYKTRKEERHC